MANNDIETDFFLKYALKSIPKYWLKIENYKNLTYEFSGYALMTSKSFFAPGKAINHTDMKEIERSLPTQHKSHRDLFPNFSPARVAKNLH